jgi:hypothetical protein
LVQLIFSPKLALSWVTQSPRHSFAAGGRVTWSILTGGHRPLSPPSPPGPSTFHLAPVIGVFGDRDNQHINPDSGRLLAEYETVGIGENEAEREQGAGVVTLATRNTTKTALIGVIRIFLPPDRSGGPHEFRFSYLFHGLVGAGCAIQTQSAFPGSRTVDCSSSRWVCASEGNGTNRQ